MRITDKYVFFYKDWLSNYQKTSFIYTWAGRKYEFSSTEKAFMFIKAKMFGDEAIAMQILITENPNECRKLGRMVKNYDEKVWDACRVQVFYDLNKAKYIQDGYLRRLLLDPKYDNKIFVEASPIDKIWGVGLDEKDPLIDDERNWKGENNLGKIITQIRNELKENEEKN